MMPQSFCHPQSEPYGAVPYITDCRTQFPPDTHTPASEQFDNMTFHGSEVTVINRAPQQAMSAYWQQQTTGCFVDPSSAYLMQHEANLRTKFPISTFENESSSTLSCVDSYHAMQQQQQQLTKLTDAITNETHRSASLLCGSGIDGETVREGGGVTGRSSPASSIMQQKGSKRRSYGENFRIPRRQRSKRHDDDEEEFSRKSSRHRSSAHCLSEGESFSHEKGRHWRDHGRRSARNQSPSCSNTLCNECDTSRSWMHGLSRHHANSLPYVKKRSLNSPPGGENKIRRKKPITGLFGANLAASLENELWSDGEQSTGDEKLRPIKSSCCGLLCLSSVCAIAVTCLISPICMLILPLFLPITFDNRKQESPASEHHSFIPPNFIFPADEETVQTILRPSSVFCDPRCEADLLSFAVKLLILCATTWQLYVLPVVTVYIRRGLRTFSVSAILNRKLDCGFNCNSESLHPAPMERTFAVTLSVNFLGFGATCAFWVAFWARWLRGFVYPSQIKLSNPGLQADLQMQFGLHEEVTSNRNSNLQPTPLAYSSLVNFVLTFTDTQLLLHLLGLIVWRLQLFYTRVENSDYVVQVVRSPDGESRTYRIAAGNLASVAAEIIHRYNVEFPMYDSQVASAPYRYMRHCPDPVMSQSLPPSRCQSFRLHRKHSLASGEVDQMTSEQDYQLKRCNSTGGSSFKFYSLDGPPATSTTELEDEGQSIDGSREGVRNVNTLCGDRYHSEVDFDRVRRKRHARLQIIIERAFDTLETLSTSQVRISGFNKPVPPRQAAQLIFPKVIVPLQKYLRMTRMQHLHPPDAILFHLTICIAHSCSADVFLSIYRPGEPFASVPISYLAAKQTPVTEKERKGDCCNGRQNGDMHLVQSWHIRSETPDIMNRPVKPGAAFRLHRAGVVLFCRVHFQTLLRIIPGRPPLRTSVASLPLEPIVVNATMI